MTYHMVKRISIILCISLFLILLSSSTTAHISENGHGQTLTKYTGRTDLEGVRINVTTKGVVKIINLTFHSTNITATRGYIYEAVGDHLTADSLVMNVSCTSHGCEFNYNISNATGHYVLIGKEYQAYDDDILLNFFSSTPQINSSDIIWNKGAYLSAGSSVVQENNHIYGIGKIFTENVLNLSTIIPYTVVPSTSNYTLLVQKMNIMNGLMTGKSYFNNTVYTTTTTEATNQVNFSFSAPNPYTLINDSILNVTFDKVLWNFTVDGNIYVSPLYNQTFYRIIVDNCSNYAQPFINYTFRDQINNEKINVDVSEYYVEYSLGGYSDIYNGSVDGADHLPFCIYPSFANFTIDEINIQYEKTGYDGRNHIDYTFVADNYTEQITLKLLTSDNSTTITCHVNDEDNNEVENALVKVYLWDVSTASYSLVETCITNPSGQCDVNLYTGVEQYKFDIYVNEVLKKSTSKFAIAVGTTDLYFRFDELTATALNIYLNLTSNIVSNLIWNNYSRKIWFNWSDPNNVANRYCLNVSRLNHTDLLFISSQCSNSNVGQISYTLPVLNTTYFAYGEVRANTDNRWYVLKTLQINEIPGWKTIGKYEGLMYFSITTMVLALLGVHVPELTLFMAGIGLIISYMMQWWSITIGVIAGMFILIIFAIIGMGRKGR